MNGLTDPERYTEGMRKSLIDKTFFMDKVDARVFMDYGCADGSLIEFLRALFPEMTYAGYDIDTSMLAKARHRLGPKDESHVFLTHDLDALENSIPKSEKSCLILSSVIHEIHAYSGETKIDEFWDFVRTGTWDFIVIRDMMVSRNADRPTAINTELKVRSMSIQRTLAEFEERWGSIGRHRNLLHYLLKYRYKENWKRELDENYLPMTHEQFLSKLPVIDYDIVFHEHYTLPFLKRRVREDFGITLNDPTHVKVILEKQNG